MTQKGQWSCHSHQLSIYWTCCISLLKNLPSTTTIWFRNTLFPNKDSCTKKCLKTFFYSTPSSKTYWQGKRFTLNISLQDYPKKRITNTRNWLQNVESWFMNMQQFLNLLVRLFLSLSISFKSGVKKVPTTFFVIVCGKIVSSILEADFCWFSSGNEGLPRNILLLHLREATKCILHYFSIFSHCMVYRVSC